MAENNTFYLHGGKTFNNLKSFAKNLKDMSHETFKHHVTDNKNDFSTWVKHSIKKDDLAAKIEKKIDKIEIELEILRHLVHDEIGKSAVKSKKTTKKVEVKTLENKPVIKVEKPVKKVQAKTVENKSKKANSKK